MELSVFGLGYVGCVSAACFARHGHRVVGVDVNAEKIAMINRGESTIVEEGVGELVEAVVAAGRLRASADVEEAVLDSAVSLVCVGTPSRPNGSIDLSHIERICAEIGQALRSKPTGHVVVIRSTVLPGTIQELVIPALERASGKRATEGFDVCCNPEFLREGSSIKDFYDPPFTLIGAARSEAVEPVRPLYEMIQAPLYVTELRVAEMVKYASNCFHAVKITFANEMGNIAKALGIDSHEVMRIVCADQKLNISPAYLKPGFAFGGSCLPKDLRAITYQARRADVETPLLAATMESNRQQIERAAQMVLDTGHRRIGLLGLSFKEGTDDLRESPMVTLAEKLIGKGLQLSIYDPKVSRSGLLGANKEFIERQIPHIWSLMCDDMHAVIAASDTLLLGNKGEEFGAVATLQRPDQIVVDLARVLTDRASNGDRYRGICW